MHQLHEEVEALVEGKVTGFPKGTKLSGALEFSNWGGKLALVSTPWDGGFDPEKMTRVYYVRFAIDPRTKKPLNAVDKFVGFEPHIFDSRAAYEKTGFSIGSYADRLVGGFGSLKTFEVQLKFKTMNDKEHHALEQDLRRRGYVDTSDIRFPQKKWKKLLGMKFTAIQASDDYQTANEVDRFVNKYLKVDTMNDDTANLAWADAGKRGVYATTRQGRVKFMIKA